MSEVQRSDVESKCMSVLRIVWTSRHTVGSDEGNVGKKERSKAQECLHSGQRGYWFNRSVQYTATYIPVVKTNAERAATTSSMVSTNLA